MIRKTYWKRVLFKTDMKARYTKMQWRKCDHEAACPYTLRDDLGMVGKLKYNKQPVLIRIEMFVESEENVNCVTGVKNE